MASSKEQRRQGQHNDQRADEGQVEEVLPMSPRRGLTKAVPCRRRRPHQ